MTLRPVRFIAAGRQTFCQNILLLSCVKRLLNKRRGLSML
ncbi:hypothetical protein HNQ50_003610 [Silvimonas terrae]|uniref:Uncharacterized protein n=1 Tax=Silvimonas terrae TaxID=300266 RepID=A0A840RKM9_9NEIS|nr:hypothetical protein [Silvimonas terrae]